MTSGGSPEGFLAGDPLDYELGPIVEAVYWAVSEAVYEAVDWDVHEAVGLAVDQEVHMPVRVAVHVTVAT